MRARRPALPASERARLTRRRVHRDGEPEDEPRAEVEHYLARSAGRLAVSLGLAERVLAGQRGARVLELGAEPWLFTQLLLERGHQVVAGGLRPGETAPAAEVSLAWDGREATVEQRLFDAESDVWPFADGSFELVLCMEVLEHLVSSPAHLLHEANRVLAPGGWLLLTTPNAIAATKLAALLRGRSVHHRYSGYGGYGRHNREFTPGEVELVLSEAGFDPDVRVENLAGYEARDALGRGLRALAALPGRRTGRRRDHVFALARKVAGPRMAFPSSLYVAFDRDRMRRRGVVFPDEPGVRLSR